MATQKVVNVVQPIEYVQYTLYLDTDDIRVAQHVARVLNQKAGSAVGALGREDGSGIAVVVHLLRWREFPLRRVLETALVTLRPLNVKISRGVLGPAPLEALLDVVQQTLLLDSLPEVAAPAAEPDDPA